MSKHWGAVWATTWPLGDPEVVDLRVEVVQHPGVLAHRPLRLTGRARGEVDVCELVSGDGDVEIVVATVLGEGVLE